MVVRFLKVLIFIIVISFSTAIATAVDPSSLSWAQICSGKMEPEWYGSSEAMTLADKIVHVQRDNGGWMKNYEFHRLTDNELEALYYERADRSCLDNNATTQEMQFLARVYSQSGVEKYRESFERAVNLLLTAQKSNGGWSQYWPIFGDGRYHDYITFNDNLITNVMRMLRSVKSNSDIYSGMVDETVREACGEAFDRGIELIINCQYNDNGTPSAWCAQHDNVTLIPVEGRPFELPSISGYESMSLLSFLMTVDRPSARLRHTIRTAIEWMDSHKIPDKAVEDFTNEEGFPDKRIIDKPGSNIWARFIQLGGPSGEAVYQTFFDFLRTRGKRRSFTWNGKIYTYTEYEIAKSSYNPEMAYQPVFSIYDNEFPHLFYRFLYNYEDSEPATDVYGVPVATSLRRDNRAGYQFMGNWGERVISVEYPAWEKRMAALDGTEGMTLYQLSQSTYTGSTENGSTITYDFADGISVSNEKGKKYGPGMSSSNTVKYSANVDYTIHLPEGMTVSEVRFTGYDNYADMDAYISRCGSESFSPSDLVFPAKDDSGNVTMVTHSVDLKENPATGELRFAIGAKQCALLITLCTPASGSGLNEVTVSPSEPDGWYDLQGRPVETPSRPGIYVSSGHKMIVR